MARLPRFFSCVTVLCAAVVLFTCQRPVHAQEAAPQAGANPDLVRSVDDFWHYAKIARYDLAVAEAQKVLAKKDQPLQVLEAFEQVATEREAAAVDPKGSVDLWLLRWQGVEALRDVTTQLLATLNAGYSERRSDPAFIETNIRRLAVNERAYALALRRLRESGELAVPQMVQYLRNAEKREFHAGIRRALVDMGRTIINPLVVATEMKDAQTLTMICAVLGEIGYKTSVPYLARLANGNDVDGSVKVAAAQTLERMGAGAASQLNASELFTSLAEKFYYNNADIAADPRATVAFVWSWDNDKGLNKKDVPPAIFTDILTMRAAEQAMKLNAGNAQALCLWLAANYKREADLPEGAKDPTVAEGQPGAHYYGVTAGAQYLNPVLARAMKDGNAAVALRAVKSLQQIIGQSNIFSGAAGTPVVDAMRSSDRLVRFEAAFALAAALPRQSFAGYESVVPVLAEALAQNGKGNILVVAANESELNPLIVGLKEAGYGAAGASTAANVLAAAATLPTVDVILATESVKVSEVDKVFLLASQSPRLVGAVRVVLAKDPQASPFMPRTTSDTHLRVAATTEKPADLKPAIEEARAKIGGLPLDEKLAGEYALRAMDLLVSLAINHNQVLDVTAAEGALLSALEDSRPEIVKGAAKVLGLLNSKPVQAALLVKANDEKTADEVKVSLYKSLASNAKFFGSNLDASQLEVLRKAVESEKNLEARSAAAEARGSMNLPADQAKSLIVNH